MHRTGFDKALSIDHSTAARLSGRFLHLCCSGILFAFCAVLGAAQCSAQDVAEAARQERAQKENKHKKSKHVYTEQDLKRAQILTPEDRAQMEAKKNQAVPPSAEKPGEAVDAQSLPPDAPLGDVARHFRKQRESQKLGRSAEFHLPFGDAPALASPKPPVKPLRPPISTPAAPRFVPYQPPVKRSPFERPKVFFSAPAPAMPSKPAAPIVHAAPGKLNAVTVKPGDSLWKLAQQNLGKGVRWRELLSVNPGIVDANHIEAGSQIYVPVAVSSFRTATRITVHKGDTLSSIAQTRLGHASFWSCIARVNPSIADPNLIYTGQTLILPASCHP
jgi:nucleoid-associated protein YgaU